jgi:hypothetical protein
MLFSASVGWEPMLFSASVGVLGCYGLRPRCLLGCYLRATECSLSSSLLHGGNGKRCVTFLLLCFCSHHGNDALSHHSADDGYGEDASQYSQEAASHHLDELDCCFSPWHSNDGRDQGSYQYKCKQCSHGHEDCFEWIHLYGGLFHLCSSLCSSMYCSG